MTEITKPRLHYFDMLKGIAIFMVVMGHVLTMCIRDIDRAVVFKFIGEVHMPLFFFISGWFSYRVNGTGVLHKPKILRRAIQLLVPMVVVSTLWIYYFPHSGLQSPLESTWSGLWFNEWKNGYWFTLCLFEIMLLHTAIIPVLTKCRTLTSEICCIIATWITLGILSIHVIPDQINALTGMNLIFQFFPIFMAGFLAHRHRDGFIRITSGRIWFSISIITGAVMLYYVCWPWEFPQLPEETVFIARSILHVSVVIIAITVVEPWSHKAFAPGTPEASHKWAGMWRYIGTKSLAIYLLHYFFLFPIPALRQPLIDTGLGFTPTLVVAAAIATMITAITLAANHIISYSNTLSLFLTGKVK